MTKVDYNAARNTSSADAISSPTSISRAVIPQGNVLAAAEHGNAVRLQNVSVNYTYDRVSDVSVQHTFGLNRQRGGSLSSAPFGFPDAGVKIAGAPDSALKAPPELSMSSRAHSASAPITWAHSTAATTPFARW